MLTDLADVSHHPFHVLILFIFPLNFAVLLLLRMDKSIVKEGQATVH